MDIFLIFPTQLYKNTKLINSNNIYLIEEPIYFTYLKYHKLKLAYHRATMKYYYDYLKKKKFNVKYIEFYNVSNIFYKNIKYNNIYIYDPIEHKLLDKLIKIYKNKLIILPSQNFLIYSDLKILKNDLYSNSYLFNKFYIYYRKKFNILIDKNNKPIGGEWSYDKYNRKKIPKNYTFSNNILPENYKIIKNKYTIEATNYINKYFNNNYGHINFIYPITHKDSYKWFNNFLKYKIDNFGEFEDAILENNPFIYHSILTPMMNLGLLIDKDILNKILEFNNNNDTNIQNIEGFIRQLFWRNYIVNMRCNMRFIIMFYV